MKFTDLIWFVLAKLISIPCVARYIIRRAKKTPYFPIYGRTDDRLYMDRWWLPSIRVHHICLPDDDDHEHDHPWNARSIILDGWYVEERLTHNQPTRVMRSGDTSPLLAGQFHRIARVSDGGVYTLFFHLAICRGLGFLGGWPEAELARIPCGPCRSIREAVAPKRKPRR